jgi:hypothetical protein
MFAILCPGKLAVPLTFVLVVALFECSRSTRLTLASPRRSPGFARQSAYGGWEQMFSGIAGGTRADSRAARGITDGADAHPDNAIEDQYAAHRAMMERDEPSAHSTCLQMTTWTRR